MTCAHGAVYGPSRDIAGGTVYLRADCKKLSCPDCGPKKAAKYKRAIAEHAKTFKLQRFMTLTLDPKKIGESQDSVSYLRKCFSKFRVYLGRKYGKQNVSYISIVELHKSGIAHLHVLVGVYIPQEWIKENWQRVGGGRIVDIRLVDIHNVAKYLSKYVTKDMLLMVPAKKKRISTSRNIRLFPPKEKSGFLLSILSIGMLWETMGKGIISDHRFDKHGLLSFVHREGRLYQI
jgi:hypothetical protein